MVTVDLRLNEPRPYDQWAAYGQSKTANVLFAVGATARWAGEGITANSLMPGAILTKLQRHVGGRVTMRAELQKTIPQGAATSVLLATSPLLEGVGGRYFVDCWVRRESEGGDLAVQGLRVLEFVVFGTGETTGLVSVRADVDVQAEPEGPA